MQVGRVTHKQEGSLMVALDPGQLLLKAVCLPKQCAGKGRDTQTGGLIGGLGLWPTTLMVVCLPKKAVCRWGQGNSNRKAN